MWALLPFVCLFPIAVCVFLHVSPYISTRLDKNNLLACCSVQAHLPSLLLTLDCWLMASWPPRQPVFKCYIAEPPTRTLSALSPSWWTPRCSPSLSLSLITHRCAGGSTGSLTALTYPIPTHVGQWDSAPFAPLHLIFVVLRDCLQPFRASGVNTYTADGEDYVALIPNGYVTGVLGSVFDAEGRVYTEFTKTISGLPQTAEQVRTARLPHHSLPAVLFMPSVFVRARVDGGAFYLGLSL